jgi:hypothetical protein
MLRIEVKGGFNVSLFFSIIYGDKLAPADDFPAVQLARKVGSILKGGKSRTDIRCA